MTLITLIRPPTVLAKWALSSPTCPPIGLAYVAGMLTDTGYKVAVVDAVGEATEQMLPTKDPRFFAHGLSTEEIIARIPAETTVFGISCMFSHEWPLISSIILAVREKFPKVPIIAGGEHITAMPQISLEQCPALDICVIGEGEETMVEVVDALTSGGTLDGISGIVFREGDKILRMEARARIRNVNDIPPPAWDLFPLSAYLERGYGFGVNRGRSMPVIATRGCPYQCTFCSNPGMWTTRWIARDVDAFFAELKGYQERYQIDNFDFYDLTAIVKKDWIVAFCNRVLESGLKFTWQLPSGTRSEAIDAEVSKLLYLSGCRNITYAPESGSPRILRLIKKKVKLGNMLKSMRESVRCGMNAKANIMMGFPGETHWDIWQTHWFCLKMAVFGVHDMSISPYAPYPGSELFDVVMANNRIPEFSDEYFYSLVADGFSYDFRSTVSYSEHVSDRALGVHRLFGLMLYYSFAFGLRPWRLIQAIRNALGERQESRFDMALRDLFFRLRVKES